MNNSRYKIPTVYKTMDKRGFFDSKSYLWLNDMEWLSIDKIDKYEYEKGENKAVISFAFTSGGDKWVWVINTDHEDYPVGLCYKEELNGVYYAKNMEDAIFRQIIEYVASSNFYLNVKDSESYQVSEYELKGLLRYWKKSFTGILNAQYLDVINEFINLKLKKVKNKYGEWYALLTLEEENELINKFISFDLLNKEFEWFSNC